MYYNKDGTWIEKGVGNLHLKPCSGKTQLLIRADTNLGEDNEIIKTIRNFTFSSCNGCGTADHVSMESRNLTQSPSTAKPVNCEVLANSESSRLYRI